MRIRKWIVRIAAVITAFALAVPVLATQEDRASDVVCEIAWEMEKPDDEKEEGSAELLRFHGNEADSRKQIFVNLDGLKETLGIQSATAYEMNRNLSRNASAYGESLGFVVLQLVKSDGWLEIPMPDSFFVDDLLQQLTYMTEQSDWMIREDLRKLLSAAAAKYDYDYDDGIGEICFDETSVFAALSLLPDMLFSRSCQSLEEKLRSIGSAVYSGTFIDTVRSIQPELSEEEASELFRATYPSLAKELICTLCGIPARMIENVGKRDQSIIHSGRLSSLQISLLRALYRNDLTGFLKLLTQNPFSGKIKWSEDDIFSYEVLLELDQQYRMTGSLQEHIMTCKVTASEEILADFVVTMTQGRLKVTGTVDDIAAQLTVDAGDGYVHVNVLVNHLELFDASYVRTSENDWLLTADWNEKDDGCRIIYQDSVLKIAAADEEEFSLEIRPQADRSYLIKLKTPELAEEIAIRVSMEWRSDGVMLSAEGNGYSYKVSLIYREAEPLREIREDQTLLDWMEEYWSGGCSYLNRQLYIPLYGEQSIQNTEKE